jgi:hypothetical protein
MSRSKPSCRLRAISEDDAVQITVFDGNLTPVAQGIRVLEVDLAPGLYEVRFEAGSSVRERLVSLVAGAGPVKINQEQIAFSSAAPLLNTQEEVSEQRDAAARVSERVHRSIGKGGQLLVFVRDQDLRARSNPARGLALHHASGEMVGEVEADGESGGGSDYAHPPWSGCTYELAPGLWRLRCPAPDLGTVEQTVAVCKGWQTQVFLQRRASQSGGPRRPDLADASVLMASVKDGFKPQLAELRATELARQGLRDRRHVVPKHQLLAMLHKKQKNPMLGIYGAHLMIHEADPDLQFIRKVTNNLRKLVGDHPDVMALELWLAPDADVGDFSQPPMLQSSWSIVVAATANRPELVPRGSHSAGISQQVLAAGPWLRWRMASSHSPQAPADAQSVPLGEALAGVADALPDDPATVARQASEASAAESGVISYAKLAGEGVLPVNDRDVLLRLGVPRTVAEDALHAVMERLDDRAL